MTHFATSDDDPAFAREQLAAFRPFLDALPGGVIAHAANSAAALGIPESRLDMVRCGIAIYGLDPFQADPADHGLRPALTLASYVAEVKPIAPGESAGYGRRYVAERDGLIATMPVGYADGVRRALTNNADVLIGGRRFPLVGTVSMDNITVAVDDTVARGDEVVLIGAQGGERILAEDGRGGWGRSTTRSPAASRPVFHALRGTDAWLVGGAVRDRLLGRPDDGRRRHRGGGRRRRPARQGAAQGDRRRGVPARRPLRRLARGGRRPRGGHPAAGRRDRWRPTSPRATSRSTRWPSRSRAGTSSIPSAAPPTSRRAACARSAPTSFTADPLRVLRLVRLAAELGFAIDAPTLAAARAAAPGLDGVAAERIFAELKRIVLAPAPGDAVRLMEDVGAAAVVLPELLALQGVEQTVYHDADVHDHTLEVLDAVARPRARRAPTRACDALLREPLADGLNRWQAMRFAALLHDIAKPDTAGTRADGRGSSFVGHDQAGADLARAILRRLRAAERLVDHVADLTRHHLRLGFLVHRAAAGPPRRPPLPGGDAALPRRRHRLHLRRPARHPRPQRRRRPSPRTWSWPASCSRTRSRRSRRR